jgi:hypothetical protein
VFGGSQPCRTFDVSAAEESNCRDKACCDGLTCINNASDQPVCRIPCAQASDCTSGCCTDLYDRGVQICAEAAVCTNPCKKRGDASCNAGTSAGERCCRGSCVEATNPDYAGCRPTCATDADCDTGCCVPFTSSQGGFCADARYCTCSSVGAPCGGDQDVECCEDTRCVAFGDTPFTCHSVCDASHPCVTGSCQSLADASGSVCYTGGGTAGSGGMGGGAGSGGAGGTGGGRFPRCSSRVARAIPIAAAASSASVTNRQVAPATELVPIRVVVRRSVCSSTASQTVFASNNTQPRCKIRDLAAARPQL